MNSIKQIIINLVKMLLIAYIIIFLWSPYGDFIFGLYVVLTAIGTSVSFVLLDILLKKKVKGIVLWLLRIVLFIFCYVLVTIIVVYEPTIDTKEQIMDIINTKKKRPYFYD